MIFQLFIEFFQIERQVLDPALAEFDVGVAQSLGDDRRVASRHFQHGVGHVHADDPAPGPDDLRGDETDFSGATAQVEHGLAGSEVTAGVAAAIVLLNDLVRDDFQKTLIVIHSATQGRFGGPGGDRITMFHGGFRIGQAHVRSGAFVCEKT